jgi:hypothetical protein
MNRKLTLLVSIALVAATAAAAQPEEEEASHRDYQLRHLDVRVAEALFWEVCEPQVDSCQVLLAAGGALRVMAPRSVQRRMTRLLAERDALPPSQRLQLHLLSAGREPGEIPAALTAGPRQALEDLAAVLGYRRFDLLDSALVDTVQAARTNLAGPAGVVLDAALHVRTVTGLENEKIHVDLMLTVPGTDEQEPAAGGAKLRPGTLLSTSLSLNAGETVVVGTSRVDGGEEGLVLLLTALH